MQKKTKTHNPKQQQCPLPGAQTGGGTLGMRRTYAAAAGDLLKQMTKLVVLGGAGVDDDEAAMAAAAAEPLVLYDPSQYGDRVAPAPPTVAAVVAEQEARPAGAAAVAAEGEAAEEQEEEQQEGGAAALAAAAGAAAAAAGNGDDADQAMSSGGSSSSSSSSSSDDDDDDDDSSSSSDNDDHDDANPTKKKKNNNKQQPHAPAPAEQPPPPPPSLHPLLGRRAIVADPWLARKLRPHQREGVRFVFECLAGLRQAGMQGCVLADGMGLGKTVQACCSIWSLLQNSVCHGPGVPTSARPIVLCPTSLVRNWGNELDKWLEGRVESVVVEDSRGAAVKEALARFAGPKGRTTAAAMLLAKLQADKEAKALEAGTQGGGGSKGPPPPPAPPARMPGKPKVLVMSC
jgi:hypothetical protein